MISYTEPPDTSAASWSGSSPSEAGASEPWCEGTMPSRAVSLSREVVAQSRLGTAAARLRKCTPEQPCATTSRAAPPRAMGGRFSEPTVKRSSGLATGLCDGLRAKQQ
jgi:hypothetical protein